MNNKISCSIVGARGYAGIETAKLLLRHPNAQLTHCFATSEFELSDFVSSSGAAHVKCFKDSELLNHLTDVVFLATPAEVSLRLAPQILEAGKEVIDLSGAFRLKKSSYEKWYGFVHTEPACLKSAEYGLAPFVVAKSQASLISNPGCYATAISLALVPLFKHDVLSEQHLVIDAKSGSTGAGKKASESLLFTEVDGECLSYKVGRHQHYPEILETVEALSGKSISAHMTTSLLPVRRGIIAGIYGELKQGKTIIDVKEAFDEAYREYPLVVHAQIENRAGLLSLKKVVGTGKAHITYEVIDDRLYLFSCIDNLLRGAASQAVENFNRVSDLPIATGVDHLEALT